MEITIVAHRTGNIVDFFVVNALLYARNPRYLFSSDADSDVLFLRYLHPGDYGYDTNPEHQDPSCLEDVHCLILTSIGSAALCSRFAAARS